MADKSTITMQMLEEIFDRKLEPLKSKIDDLMKTVSFISDQYDDLTKRVKTLEQEKDKLTEENRGLKLSISLLSAEMQQLSATCEDQLQYWRRNCLEIRGIPLQLRENTNELVREIGSMIGINIYESDIDTSHRLPVRRSAKYPPSIIVKFVRRDLRDEVFKQKKKLKDFTTRNIPDLSRLPQSRIFIVESLTKASKNLYKNSQKVKKDLDYKFLWTRQGKIFLRKDEDSTPIRISCQQDLDNICD